MPHSPEYALERIRTRLPDRTAKLTKFPSGAFMIDVSVGSEVHVVEYLRSVGQRFGVSRMSTAVFGWEGVEKAFESLEEVEDYLVAVSVTAAKE
jgi:hypothetical protein